MRSVKRGGTDEVRQIATMLKSEIIIILAVIIKYD